MLAPLLPGPKMVTAPAIAPLPVSVGVSEAVAVLPTVTAPGNAAQRTVDPQHAVRDGRGAGIRIDTGQGQSAGAALHQISLSGDWRDAGIRASADTVGDGAVEGGVETTTDVESRVLVAVDIDRIAAAVGGHIRRRILSIIDAAEDYQSRSIKGSDRRRVAFKISGGSCRNRKCRGAVEVGIPFQNQRAYTYRDVAGAEGRIAVDRHVAVLGATDDRAAGVSVAGAGQEDVALVVVLQIEKSVSASGIGDIAGDGLSGAITAGVKPSAKVAEGDVLGEGAVVSEVHPAAVPM